jgi:hypothetical protein
MPRLHSLKVLASGASGKCEFELSPIGDPESWSVSGECGAEGQAIFDGLPEGTYRLKRSGGGESGDMIVAIPGQSEVVFQPRKQNAVQLMLVDAESELVRAGFKTGDLIVGANGVMFDDQEAWRALLRQVMKEKSASFLVERGGTTVEIHFDPAKLIEGGVLQPASR